MQGESRETGTVLETEGALATVITNKSKACNECGKAQAGICGKKGAGITMSVRNPAGAKKGDTVIIELAKTTHIKAYFFFFVFPVIALFVFAYIGSVTGVKGLDVWLGLAGLIISLVYSFYKIRSIERSETLHIAKILHHPPEFTNGVNACPEEEDYISAFSRNH
jgi:positive regulator of sigma E activity